MERLGRATRGWFVLGVALAVASAAFGCSESLSPTGVSETKGENSTVTSSFQIDGGTKDTSSTAVVALLIRASNQSGLCTGTLLAPNLVLTARHCIAQKSQRRSRCGSTTFTGTVSPGDVTVTTDADIRDQNLRDRYYVDQIRVPNDSQVCGNDIALLQLQSNVPSNRADPRAPRLSKPTSSGENYIAIGYGEDSSQNGSGERRRLENRTVQCVGGSCSQNTSGGEWIGNGGVCQGDSGGGAYLSDKRVMGVAARGDRQDCNYAVYTSVYPKRKLIQNAAATAAQAGGYQVPSWTNISDKDGDGIPDSRDNCPATKNQDQADLDGDGTGDVCDSDVDGDEVPDGQDNCVRSANPEQSDLDGDGDGDACDEDLEGDGVPNESDVCPNLRNPDQQTSGSDGSCKDTDGDVVADAADNCPETNNPKQKDRDNDGTGDACEGGGSGSGSGGGTSGGGSSGGSSDGAAIEKPDDDGGAARRGCSTASEPAPGRAANYLLAGLLLVGFVRLRRRG